MPRSFSQHVNVHKSGGKSRSPPSPGHAQRAPAPPHGRRLGGGGGVRPYTSHPLSRSGGALGEGVRPANHQPPRTLLAPPSDIAGIGQPGKPAIPGAAPPLPPPPPTDTHTHTHTKAHAPLPRPPLRAMPYANAPPPLSSPRHPIPFHNTHRWHVTVHPTDTAAWPSDR